MQYAALILSWQEYLGCMFTAILIYWILVAVFCFGKTIKDFLTGRFRKNSGHDAGAGNEENPFVDPGDEVIPGTDTAEGNSFRRAWLLLVEVSELLEDAGQRKLVREELMQALTSQFQRTDYDSLKNSDCREYILHQAAIQAKYYCSIQFSKEEVRMLWK